MISIKQYTTLQLKQTRRQLCKSLGLMQRLMSHVLLKCISPWNLHFLLRTQLMLMLPHCLLNKHQLLLLLEKSQTTETMICTWFTNLNENLKFYKTFLHKLYKLFLLYKKMVSILKKFPCYTKIINNIRLINFEEIKIYDLKF